MNKYRVINTPKIELFDLSKDLSELMDLSKEDPELAKELENELNSFLKNAGAETRMRKVEAAFCRLLDELGER